jgi:hypothetical protein
MKKDSHEQRAELICLLFAMVAFLFMRLAGEQL